MSHERVTAFILYMNDNIDMIRTSGMTPDEAYDIAQKEWKDLLKNNKDIASEYIKREIDINSHSSHSNCSSYQFGVQFVGMNPFMFNCGI